MSDTFYGKYRAIVVNTDDPEMSGRIRVQCPRVLGDSISNWALPNLPPCILGVPKIGTMVWLEFEEGKKDDPIWTGCFYTADQWSSIAGGFDPSKYVLSAEGELNIQCSSVTSNQKFPT